MVLFCWQLLFMAYSLTAILDFPGKNYICVWKPKKSLRG